MCGISGFYSPNSFLAPPDITRMVEVMPHRGPDATGTINFGPVTLGHNRLSIIDLSQAANQPMISATGNSVIVFNGEVYNFKEIAATLNLSPRTSSDTEIIVEAFEKFGPRFVEQLNGMFAMAIYHIPTKTLYLYRDRMGIKPLYYFVKNNTLVFASEIKALTALPQLRRHIDINPLSVGRFLHFGYVPGPDTIYSQIFKFPQGHYASFNGQTLSVMPYWGLNLKITKLNNLSLPDAIETLRQKLTQSVKYRMVADVPYGTFLSGGTDSSLITAIAQSLTSTNVKTFTIGFAHAKYNEAAHAKKVAQHLGTNHHEFILSEEEAIKLVPDLFHYYDEPFADSSALPTMLVSKMARQHVTMTLAGDGGDELFHGYGSYQWARRLNNPALWMASPVLRTGLSMFGERYKRVAHLFDPVNTERLKSHIFSQEQYFFSQHELNRLLLSQQKLPVLPNENPVITIRHLSVVQQQALFDLHYYLPNNLLTKVDIASMRYSLEARVPLLDHNIVEFALNLPDNLKIHQGQTKYLLKQLLYQYVPQPLLERPKWGFAIPLKNWLKSDLEYLIFEYLSDKRLQQAQLVNVAYVKRLLKLYNRSGYDYLYNRVWALIVLHRWYFDIYRNLK
jgi:asparagine synthase (glutamine-hydrolysing)